MSFNIAISTEDLVVLVSDRRSAVLPKNYKDGMKEEAIKNCLTDDQSKILKINRNTFALGIGWNTFFIPWMKSLKLFHIVLTRKEMMEPLGKLLWLKYCSFERRLKKMGITADNWGLTWLSLGGFLLGEANVVNFSSQYAFTPRFIKRGFIYSKQRGWSEESELLTRSILEDFISLRDYSIELRKDVFLREIKKLMLHLSDTYKTISPVADVIFITREGTAIEVLNKKNV